MIDLLFCKFPEVTLFTLFVLVLALHELINLLLLLFFQALLGLMGETATGLVDRRPLAEGLFASVALGLLSGGRLVVE